jgi:hypothetical protein
MNVEAVPRSYRGVRCLSCRQPIPLPAILIKMDSTLTSKAPDSVHDHPTRVFSLRCRACEREKPYRASDILDFEGEPRTRVSRAHTGHPKRRLSASLSRGANG